MIALLALSAMTPAPVAPASPPRAVVRILSGARLHLGPSSKARLIKASVRIEDGQRRPAYLIEFE